MNEISETSKSLSVTRATLGITKIKRALISVSNKTNLVSFAQELDAMGVEIISTGGTAKALADAGVKVISITDETNFPEIMDGRVKTLHPKVHGGILACRDNLSHLRDMDSHNLTAIDLVVVDLYPFEQVVASGSNSYQDIIENIDIGGVTMIRAAAKNYAYVTVIFTPNDYSLVLQELRSHGGVTESLRKRLAVGAFALTSSYDLAIHSWFRDHTVDQGTPNDLDAPLMPCNLFIRGSLKQRLRYGENPHQQAALYSSTDLAGGIVNSRQLQGKPLSYNNYNDSDSAFSLVSDISDFNRRNNRDVAAIAIIKHANPCGVAIAPTPKDAYLRALASDPRSAFGGVIACSQYIDEDAANEIISMFIEVLIAPGFSPAARQIFATKPNVRLLEVPDLSRSTDRHLHRMGRMTFKSISGGILLQEQDMSFIAVDSNDLRIVTSIAPSAEQLSDLIFASIVAKHSKSNAIVYAWQEMTFGIGAGQTSRISAARTASQNMLEFCPEKTLDSPEKAPNIVMASEAFFPFPDSIEAASEVGVRAIIQPGGSINDDKIIAVADSLGISMVFTGIRNFKH